MIAAGAASTEMSRIYFSFFHSFHRTFCKFPLGSKTKEPPIGISGSESRGRGNEGNDGGRGSGGNGARSGCGGSDGFGGKGDGRRQAAEGAAEVAAG